MFETKWKQRNTLKQRIWQFDTWGMDMLYAVLVLTKKLHKPPTRNLWRCIYDAAAQSWPEHTIFLRFILASISYSSSMLERNLSLTLSTTWGKQNKKHVQFLPPAALEAAHTCNQSSRQSAQFCLVIQIENNNKRALYTSLQSLNNLPFFSAE